MKWLFVGPQAQTLVIACESPVTAFEVRDFAMRRLRLFCEKEKTAVNQTGELAREDVTIRWHGNDSNPKGADGPRRLQIRENGSWVDVR